MAKFKKGNKLSRGGRKGNKGGRPTKKELALRQAELEGLAKAKAALERELGKRAAKLAKRYCELAERDAATTRHAVDRVLPAAKQELDLTVHGKVEVFTNVQPDLGPQRK